MVISRTGELFTRLNLSAAARAMGEAAVQCVRTQMLTGYDKPILDTGALLQDVSFLVQDASVIVGNTLSYAPAVHDGTATLPARPYLTDGILGNIPALRHAASQAITSSFRA